jgi:hypothetical protein
MQVLFLAAANCGGVSGVKTRGAAIRFSSPFKVFLPVVGDILYLLEKCNFNKLPRCLLYSGNLASVSKLAEADTANAILTKVSMRSATDLASVVSTSRELRLSLLLEYH